MKRPSIWDDVDLVETLTLIYCNWESMTKAILSTKGAAAFQLPNLICLYSASISAGMYIEVRTGVSEPAYCTRVSVTLPGRGLIR